MMKTKVKGNKKFKDIETGGKVAELLKLIRSASREVNTNASVYDTIDESKRRYYLYRQQPHDSNEQHTKTFKSNVEVAEHEGATLFTDAELVKYEREQDNDPDKEMKDDSAYYDTIKEKAMGVALLKRSDMTRYKPLLTDIRDQHGYGQDVYPKTLAAAHNMLEDYARTRKLAPKKKDGRKTGPGGGKTRNLNGQMYNQLEYVAGTNGKIYRSVQCHGCHNWGHYVKHCPEVQQHLTVQEEEGKNEQEREVDGDNHLQFDQLELDSLGDSDDSYVYHLGFSQVDEDAWQMVGSGSRKIDKSCLLIDSGSTFSVVNDPKMVTGLRKSKKPINGVSNGGSMKSTMEGDMPGWFTVYVNQASLLNILALADVVKRFKVTMDTSKEDAIIVHISDSKELKFERMKNGLYIWKPFNNNNANTNNKKVSPYSFLTLVEANKENFTRREIKGADDARKLYINLGLPGYKSFFKALESNAIRDCPITVDDAKRYLHIYGPEVAKLKGSTTRKKPSKIGEYLPVQIPKTIMDHHNTDVLNMDYMYVQKVSFHHSISTNYKYRTTKPIRGKKKPNARDTVRCSKKAVNKYHARQVGIIQINADNEFTALEGKMANIALNIVAAGEHVGNIERSIRTIKEHTRCTVHRLPYRRYPTEMVCGAVIKADKDINMRIHDDGVSRDLPPGSLIEGKPTPKYEDIIKLNFGDYVHAHVPSTKTNDNEPRTTGAIALYPSGNAQGSWYFMSLDTGKRIHRFQWTVLPLTKAVKDRVEYIAEQQGQPLVASNFVYERSIDGEEVDDDENENEELDLEEWNEPQPPPAMLALEDNDGDDASTNSDVDDDVETGAEEVNNEMEEVQEAVVEDDNEQIEEREMVSDPDNDEVEREEVEEEASVYTTRSGRSTKKIDYSAIIKRALHI